MNSSYIVYDYTTSGHKPVNINCTYSIYTFLKSIHTLLYNIFIYFKCSNNIILSSIPCGTVHSNRTVVVLLHKHFSS